MNATQTAINVIEWAFNGLGPLPQGDLYDTPALSHPNQALREAMQTLTVIQAAQMYFGSAPFLGDKKPLGVGGALLAAAIGVLHWPESAQQLLKAVPRAHSSADWIIRHALVARVLPLLAEHSGHAVTHLTADLLLVSPLTALVNVPVASQENEMMSLVEQLLEQPASRRWLQLNLAEPTDNQAIRDWRQKILAQLRQTEQDSKTSFVLDVYETLMIHHRSVAFDQVGAARRVLRDPIAAASAQRLQEALSIAQWWHRYGPYDVPEKRN
jgi:hypothetical protein